MRISKILMCFAVLPVGCGKDSNSNEQKTIDAACLSKPPAEASEGQDVIYYCKEYKEVRSDDLKVLNSCRLNDILRGYSAEWQPNEACPTQDSLGSCKLTRDGFTFKMFYYSFPDGISSWPNTVTEAEQHCINEDELGKPIGAWTTN